MADRDLAIQLANKRRAISILQSCHIEGIKCTLYDINMFMNGMINESFSGEAKHFICSLNDTWKFLMDNLDADNNLMIIRELNKRVISNSVYGSGELRTIDVSIGGTTWKPRIPITGIVIDDLEKLDACKDLECRAVSFFCYLIRSQLFIDGNKRVAQLMCNKILIENGIGMLNIKEESLEEFKTLLMQWYESGSPANLFEFIRSRCIKRI